jgi:hypothetical protein
MSGSTNDPTATPSEPTSTIPNPIHEQLGKRKDLLSVFQKRLPTSKGVKKMILF